MLVAITGNTYPVKEQLKDPASKRTKHTSMQHSQTSISLPIGLPMYFQKIPNIYPEQSLWVAKSSLFSFVISEEGGLYSASASPLDNTEFIKPIRIGEYEGYSDFEAAIAACEKFLGKFARWDADQKAWMVSSDKAVQARGIVEAAPKQFSSSRRRPSSGGYRCPECGNRADGGPGAPGYMCGEPCGD